MGAPGEGGVYLTIKDHTKMFLPAPLGMGAAVKLSSKELKNYIEALCNLIMAIVFFSKSSNDNHQGHLLPLLLSRPTLSAVSTKSFTPELTGWLRIL